MEEEIQNQIEDLPAFARDLRNRPGQASPDPSRTIFTGSGDSFAAAIFARSLTGGRAAAEDPYELCLHPEWTKGKILFLISVSGRTRTNLTLAKRVKGLAWRRVAITANPDSPLATVCDDIILLRYRSSGILTAGTVGFTSSLLAVASVTVGLPKMLDLKAMARRAIEATAKATAGKHSAFFFLGSGLAYALSAYGAFKINEVLGLKAEYQQSEQIGHAQLFSMRRRNDTVVCIALGPDRKAPEIFQHLFKQGFRAYLFEGAADHFISASLEVSLHLQHLALSLAKSMRLRECSFLTDKGRLDLSSQLIY